MNEHKKKIQETDFDNLIVLDACRYDVFKKFYNLFPNIEGELHKIHSPGNNTLQTLYNVFDDEYDWDVVSAHPALNSYGIPPQMPGLENDTYTASEHFREIENLWEKSEDGEMNAVKSEEVTKHIINSSKDYSKNTALIWLMQPHAPHTGSIKLQAGPHVCKSPLPFGYETPEDSSKLPIGREISSLVHQSYKFNLFDALFEVSYLIHYLDGTTAVTSDHGEILFDDGEKDFYGHPTALKSEKLTTVPFIHVEEENTLDIKHCNITDFVQSCYRNVLGREPDNEGIETYTSKIREGSLNRKQVIETLIQSEEFAENFSDPNQVIRQNDTK